jgi:hypothetical protein
MSGDSFELGAPLLKTQGGNHEPNGHKMFNSSGNRGNTQLTGNCHG